MPVETPQTEIVLKKEKEELGRIKRMLGSRRQLMCALMRRPALGATLENKKFLVFADISGERRVATRSFSGTRVATSSACEMLSTPRGSQTPINDCECVNIGLSNH